MYVPIAVDEKVKGVLVFLPIHIYKVKNEKQQTNEIKSTTLLH